MAMHVSFFLILLYRKSFEHQSLNSTPSTIRPIFSYFFGKWRCMFIFFFFIIFISNNFLTQGLNLFPDTFLPIFSKFNPLLIEIYGNKPG